MPSAEGGEMPDIILQVADPDSPLGPADWAELWADLVQSGCTCTLSGEPQTDDGAKVVGLAMLIMIGVAGVSRLADTLVRFYQARHQARVSLTAGDREWTFENVSVAEFKEALEEAVAQLSATQEQK